MSVTTDHSYAGDVTAHQAWALLEENPKAQLIDVRTEPEWSYVGIPVVDALGRQTLCIAWLHYPSMAVNPSFAADLGAQLEHMAVEQDTPLLFVCRSGVRSRDAAIAMTRAGYTRAYNVMGGFEGAMNAEGHRGTVDGWKVANLPWKQF